MIQYNDPAVSYDSADYTWGGEFIGVAPPASTVDRRPGYILDLRQTSELTPVAVFGVLASTQDRAIAELRGMVFPPEEGWLLGIDDGTPEGSLLATVFG